MIRFYLFIFIFVSFKIFATPLRLKTNIDFNQCSIKSSNKTIYKKLLNKTLPPIHYQINHQDMQILNKVFLPIEQSGWKIYYGTGKFTSNNSISIPFTLYYSNQNCTYYGNINISDNKSLLTISKEICTYRKINKCEISLNSNTNLLPDKIDYRSDQNLILNVSSFYQLISNNIFKKFGDKEVFIQGIQFDKDFYLSRKDDVMLPSYSLSKFLSTYMALKIIDESQESYLPSIHDDVTTCLNLNEQISKSWEGISFLDTINHQTGHTFFPYAHDYHIDESSFKMQTLFFTQEDEDLKLNFALSIPPIGTKEQFRYQTSNNFLAFKSIEECFKKYDPKFDLFNEIFNRYYKPLGIKKDEYQTIRAKKNGHDSIAYSGYGQFFTTDALKKMISFIAKEKLIQDPIDFHRIKVNELYEYNRGVWYRDIKITSNCTIKIPFLSGHGGINIIFFPNGVNYFSFRDDSQFVDLEKLAKRLHQIRPFCQK